MKRLTAFMLAGTLVSGATTMAAAPAQAAVTTIDFAGTFPWQGSPFQLYGYGFTGRITYDTATLSYQDTSPGGQTMSIYGDQAAGISAGTFHGTYAGGAGGTGPGSFTLPIRINFQDNIECSSGSAARCSQMTVFSLDTGTGYNASFFAKGLASAFAGGPGLPAVFPGLGQLSEVSVSYYTPFGNGSASSVTSLTSAAAPGAGGVPEPATWAMLVLGFGAVGGAARTRKRMAALV